MVVDNLTVKFEEIAGIKKVLQDAFLRSFISFFLIVLVSVIS